MAKDIDIKTNQVLDNPACRNIAIIKQEPNDEAPEHVIETWDCSKTVKYETINVNGLSTPIDMSLPHNCKVEVDRHISVTDKSVLRKANNDTSTQIYLEISADVHDASRTEKTETYKVECEVILKKEILTCNVCFKESDEEMCKQCVLEMERRSPQTPLDRVMVVDNTKNIPEVTFANDTYVSINRSDSKQQLEKPTGEISYKCVDESTHVKRKLKKFFCDICEYRCIYKSRLALHLRKHTGEKPYRCDLCVDYTCSHRSQLYNHIKAKHTKERKYSCNMCEYKSLTKFKLNEHIRQHTGEKPYKCDMCDYTCSQGGHLKNHIKAKHTNEKNYSCNLCEYKCVTKTQLNTHLQKHTGEKPYKCDLCDYRSSNSCHLKNHIRAKHTHEKNYSCTMCEYKSISKSYLNQHLRKHTGEKPYKCNLCDYSSSQSNSLKNHIKAKHTNEKNYSCNMCEYKFVTKIQLNYHLRKHTGDKPYTCEFCDYTCLVGTHLKNHISAKHTNEKNYSCNMCEYKCVTKGNLIRHRRKHTGEKPYECDLCDSKFSLGSHLKNHVRAKHTTENNYSCNICEYKCVTKLDLNQHLQKHPGEKQYKCDLCDYTCLQSGSLIIHIGEKHTNEKNYISNIANIFVSQKPT